MTESRHLKHALLPPAPPCIPTGTGLLPPCSHLLRMADYTNLFALASSVLGTSNPPKLAQTQQPSTPHSRALFVSRLQRTRDTQHTQAYTYPAAAYIARPHPLFNTPRPRANARCSVLQHPPQSIGLAQDQDVGSHKKEPSPSVAGSPGG